MRKFRRGVRGSGKVEVGGKRWFVGNKERRGGKGVAKREAAASRIAPSYANLFMGHLEQEFLNSEPYKPSLWLRFIDDIFLL